MHNHFDFCFINAYYFCADQPSSPRSSTSSTSATGSMSSRNSYSISINTVLRFLNSSNDPKVEEIKRNLKKSANGKSRLGLEQAMKVLTENKISDNEDIKIAFKAFDINEDNFIDASDLISAFKKLKIKIAESEAQQIIGNICQTGDNKITFNEFENLLRPTN